MVASRAASRRRSNVARSHRAGASRGTTRRDDDERPGARRAETRRGVSRAAWPVRRRRHGAGPARTGEPCVCRQRRAGVGGGHGQSDHEGAVRGRAACRSAAGTASCGRVGSRSRRACCKQIERARPAGVRQAGQPRIERRHLEGEDARGAGAGDRAGASSSIARSSSKPRCRTRARSSAPCSATTIRRRRCPARSCRRASSTTTRPSTSTRVRRP